MKQKSTGLSVTGSAGAASRSKRLDALPNYPFFAICVEAYEPFLDTGKPYKVIKPHKNDPPHMFRVVDEEGEDYLYPRSMFVPIRLEPKQQRRLSAALAGASAAR